jgi:hypothetical protein
VTLSTHVRLHTYPPIGADGVLAWISRELLGAQSPPQTYANEDRIGNEPGQGFPAWVIVRHNDGALIVDDSDDPDDPDEAAWLAAHRPPAAYLDVDFDTAYGYHDDVHPTPAVLHADYIVQMSNRFGDLSWCDEFTGAWHRGLAGLEAFIGNGDAAASWFRTIVVPAVASRIPGAEV